MAAVINNGNTAVTDAEVVVTVLTDFSAAFVTLYPPQNGGKDVTIDMVMQALSAKSVKHNVNTEAINELVKLKEYDKEIKAAQAQMPINGKDGTITYAYSKENVLAPKEDEQGFVDYKDLGMIRNIRENDIIATITLPEDGADGVDIRGVVMKAIPGRPVSFNLGPGTRLAEDGLSIYAAFDGHVCFKNNAFCVENTVTIGGDVDVSVGNLDFIGDIVIKGEVMEGFTVSAAKNITISGNATGAVIKAGGSVTIKKGCINTNITAHGDVSCQFCEHSKIITDGNLKAQSFVICDVYCAGNLTAKALNGGKYTILGDTEVTYLGTKNYAPTEVIAGDNAVLLKEKEAAVKQLSELDVKIERCTQIVDFLNEKRKQLKHLPEDKEELLGTTVKTKISCQMEKKMLRKRIAEIDASLAQKQYRCIVCKGTVYPGVRVTINDTSKKIETETVRVKIYLDESGNVATGPV